MAVVVCTECGGRSPEGVQFCGRCGAFLEWVGGPAPPVDGGPAGPPPGDPPGAPVSGSPVVDSPVGRAPAEGSAAVGPPVEGSPAGGRPINDPPRGRPDVGAALPGPVARRPDEVPRRQQVAAPAEPEPRAPGDVPCPACGAGNDRDRRFCRSCWKPLTPVAAEAVRPPWWRRLLRRLPGRPVYRAGDRRRVASPITWWRPVLLVAALLALLLVGVSALSGRGLLGKGASEMKDRTSRHVPVTPVSARASSAAPGAAAEHVFDGASNMYWAPAGSAEGAWVEVDFAQPVRLLDVIVTPGISTDKQQFLTQARPHELDVTVTTRTGTTHTTLTLRDAPGGQTFAVKAGESIRVRFMIKSVYGASPGRRCAVAELEFFGLAH